MPNARAMDVEPLDGGRAGGAVFYHHGVRHGSRLVDGPSHVDGAIEKIYLATHLEYA